MRRQISWLVVATTSAVVISFVVPLCLLVRTLAEDRAMVNANQEARNVAILVAGVHGDPQLAQLVGDVEQRGAPATSVLLPDGTVLGAEHDMAADPEVRRAAAGRSITVTDADGGRVLLPVGIEDGTAVVRTVVTPDQLREGVATAWAGIIGLGALLLVLALTVALRLGARMSQPLHDVAGVAHRLREGELDARARVGGTVEVDQLGRALNGLADRTEELLASERATVADLSHRLRTPVTALRLDAEAVPDEELAGRLADHVAVLQGTIDEIVREARRPLRHQLEARCDATDVVGERARFWSALAEDQERSMTVALPDRPLAVRLTAVDLADVVDVLVDNVFAHTPAGTSLAVRLHAGTAGPSAELVVQDDGPGSDVPSGRRGTSGHGLDLVGRVIGGAGGSVDLADGPGGFTVRVSLPRTDG